MSKEKVLGFWYEGEFFPYILGGDEPPAPNPGEPPSGEPAKSAAPAKPGTGEPPVGDPPPPDTKTPEELAKEIKELTTKLDKSGKATSSLERRIDQLTREKKEAQAAVAKGKDKGWDDLSIQELRQYRNHFKKEDNDEMVIFLEDKIIDKKAGEVADKKVSQGENKTIRAATWAEAQKKYPDLKDKDSEHFQLAGKILAKYPQLNDINKNPQGHAVAAYLAAEELLYGKIHNKDALLKLTKDQIARANDKASLEPGGARPAVDTGSLDKLEKAALASGDPYSSAWRRYTKALQESGKDGSGSKPVGRK